MGIYFPSLRIVCYPWWNARVNWRFSYKNNGVFFQQCFITVGKVKRLIFCCFIKYIHHCTCAITVYLQTMYWLSFLSCSINIFTIDYHVYLSSASKFLLLWVDFTAMFLFTNTSTTFLGALDSSHSFPKMIWEFLRVFNFANGILLIFK